MSESDTRLRVATGEALFRQGDAGSCAYLVERGIVDIVIEAADSRTVIARRGAGEIVGEMAIIDGRPRTATAIAAEPCELMVITKDQLAIRLAETDPVVRLCLSVVLDRFRLMLAEMADGGGTAAPRRHAPAAAPPPQPAPGMAETGDVGHRLGLETLRLEQELLRGIARDELALHLQPIVALSGGAVVGFEALIRWHHPSRGLLAPGAFIPVAEETGLVAQLTRWAFRDVCRIARTLPRRRHAGADRPAFVTVNLSARDFLDPDLYADFHETLARSGVDPGLVKLEVTESAVIQQPERAAAILQRLRALGLRLALDDFGTGQSSLGYLDRFPFDTLKLDRSFTSGMMESRRTAAIVRAVLGLATELEMPVVAEGIETPEQAAALRQQGCRYGQGWLFGRPLPEAQAVLLLGAEAAPAEEVPLPAGPGPTAAPCAIVLPCH